MFAGLLLLAPVFAQARGLVPCGGYKDDGTLEHICTVNDAFYLAARVTNWLIMLAGLYAVVRIIYAGAMLTFSQGNQESVTKYQGALTNAIIGFVLVMTSFLIVNTVVNTLLLSKCKIDLRNPTTYLSIQPADNNCK
jgi:hypothetical protein